MYMFRTVLCSKKHHVLGELVPPRSDVHHINDVMIESCLRRKDTSLLRLYC